MAVSTQLLAPGHLHVLFPMAALFAIVVANCRRRRLSCRRRVST